MENNLPLPVPVLVEVTLESGTQDLYELCQQTYLPPPEFQFEQNPGTSSRMPSFTATCTMPGFITTGNEKSKKLAKQAASANMIKLLISKIPSCKDKYQNKKLKKKKKSHVVPEIGEFHECPEKAIDCLNKLCKRTGSSLNFEFYNQPFYKYQLQTVHGSAEGCGSTPKEAIESASRIILENYEQLGTHRRSEELNDSGGYEKNSP